VPEPESLFPPSAAPVEFDEDMKISETKRMNLLEKGRVGGKGPSLAREYSSHGKPRSVRQDKTILVMTRDDVMRNVLATALSDKLCHRVLKVTSPMEAMSEAENGKEIHLLLMDVSAPEKVDMQLVLWFRAMHPDIRVLVSSDSLWEINFQLGVSQQIALIAKPFTASKLAEVVRKTLS
jgi:CheY-like chemotaxis protein